MRLTGLQIWDSVRARVLFMRLATFVASLSEMTNFSCFLPSSFKALVGFLFSVATLSSRYDVAPTLNG